MAQNKKWGINYKDDKDMYVVLFSSRNKDNSSLDGFKERRQSFITTKTPQELKGEFTLFLNEGLENEMSRMYYSVNSRDKKRVKNQLIHFLIDEDDFNITSINSKLAGIASLELNRKSKKWLFDFDNEDGLLCIDFMNDIKKIDHGVNVERHMTPHGFAVITDRGFDTRNLMNKWSNCVTLIKDGLLCVGWGVNKNFEEDEINEL